MINGPYRPSEPPAHDPPDPPWWRVPDEKLRALDWLPETVTPATTEQMAAELVKHRFAARVLLALADSGQPAPPTVVVAYLRGLPAPRHG